MNLYSNLSIGTDSESPISTNNDEKPAVIQVYSENVNGAHQPLSCVTRTNQNRTLYSKYFKIYSNMLKMIRMETRM